MQGHDTDRVKLDAALYRVQCLYCNQDFDAKRSDATFCSPRCRVAYNRQPQKLQNAIEDLAYQGRRFNELANRYKTNRRMFAAMQQLQKDLNNALACFEQE